MSKVAFVTSGTFAAEVENEPGAVVVDFTATWCPPCKMLAPVLERVAEHYQGRVKFFKCDVDDSVEVASKYAVQTIPNLLFFKNGEIVDQSVGFINEKELSTKVDSALNGA